MLLMVAPLFNVVKHAPHFLLLSGRIDPSGNKVGRFLRVPLEIIKGHLYWKNRGIHQCGCSPDRYAIYRHYSAVRAISVIDNKGIAPALDYSQRHDKYVLANRGIMASIIDEYSRSES